MQVRFRVLAVVMVTAAFASATYAQPRSDDSDVVPSHLAAERMLASILRSAPGGIGVVVDRVIVQVNDYILQLTGYSREELLGKSARIFYPTDADYEFVGREKYRQIAEKGTGTVETRWKTKDGRILEVILSSTPLDASNLSSGVVFTVTDITERNRTARELRNRTRAFLAGSALLILFQLGLILALARASALRHKAAEALRLSQERFDLAMLAVNDGIWDWDIPSNSVYFDPRYYTISGYEPDEFPHRFAEFEKRVHPEDRQMVLAQAKAHLEGATPVFDVEFRFLRKDGTYMWIRGRGRVVTRDEAGKVIRMIGTHTDVTDKKSAEEELKALNETLEQRIRDRTRELNEMNANLLRTNEELQRTLETLHGAQDSLVQSEKLAALGQLIAGIAHELNTPLGAIVSSNQSLVLLVADRLQEASRAIAELSPEVRSWYQSALKASLSAQTLAEEPSGRFRRRKALAARLAPDGRSVPDSLLESLLDLNLDKDSSIPDLIRGHPDFPGAVEALDTLSSIKRITDVIALAADKCANVVSALLYYVRNEEDEDVSSRVEIPKELDSLLTLYTNKTKYGIRIEKDYGCPGLVLGNRNQLNQVWMNLIQNALQAMEFKGTLGLGVRD
ncbi:MAG: PAS domain S-box protein, partial [Treponema sp.]|nr:PAS domain S-box protein [Treponema sp.]